MSHEIIKKKIQPTVEQKQAIQHLGSNVIVSASAGTGKTAVLIDRLMKRIVEDRIPIQTVCALTFTEAAAQEMKTRLLEALHLENQENPQSFLQKQISLVETAQITTIHSFCLSLIKDYAHVIGLNPQRSENILDEAQVQLLKNEAFMQVLNKSLEDNYEKTYHMLDYFSSNPINLKQFKEAVYETEIWLTERKNKEQSIQEVLAVYQSRTFSDLNPKQQASIFKEYKYYVEEILNLLPDLIQVIENEAGPQTKAYKNLNLLRQKYDHLLVIMQKINNQDSSFYNEFIEAVNIPMPSVRSSENFKLVKTALEKLIKDSIKDYQNLEEHFKMLNDLYPLVDSFLAFSLDFHQNYQNLKELENSLDFTDFENYALEILQANNQQVALSLQGHYQEIMIDEFQDTNEIQDEIIRLISNGKNLFRVGDIKQSIYRFRGAKPQIMTDLMSQDDHKTLYLSKNFRSKDSIVQFNNFLFDQLMNLTQYSRYADKDHVSCGQKHQLENSPKVRIELFTRDKDTDYQLSKDQQKALYIAQEMIALQKTGYDFKDMTVLVRSHYQKKFLKDVFEELHIPHYINEPIGFYNSEIIQDVLSFLKLIQNFNDQNLVRVLRSKFYNYDLNDLAILKLDQASSIKQAWYQKKPKEYELLESQLKKWKSMDLVSVLQDLYRFKDSYNRNFSIQEKTNLDFLLDKAINFQSQDAGNIPSFLSFIHALEDEKSSEASHLSSQDDVVQVMTTHQSKGLQFPVVFYWGIGRLSVQDHRNNLLIDDELGFAFNHLVQPYRFSRKTLLRTNIEFKQKNEELEEMLRLLYVALTRAEKEMIIVDVNDDFKQESLNRHLLYNYSRQVELLINSPNPYQSVQIRDALEISNEKLSPIKEKPSVKLDKLAIKPKFEKSKDEPFGLAIDLQAKNAMNYGTKLHEAIENLPHRPWTNQDLENLDLQLHTALKTYNQNKFTVDLYQKDEILHESPFILREEQDYISGFIDFIALDDQEAIIVDFKSDNADQETLIYRYQEQLNRYKKAVKLEFPNLDVKAYIYSFHLNQYILI